LPLQLALLSFVVSLLFNVFFNLKFRTMNGAKKKLPKKVQFFNGAEIGIFIEVKASSFH
jgi:hypothetical protein